MSVHSGQAATQSSDAIGARAYTVGSHIVLGGGETAGTTSADQVLVHELVHVAQQPDATRGGASPAHLGTGLQIIAPDGDPLERQADALSHGLAARAVGPGAPLHGSQRLGHPGMAAAVHRQPKDPLDQLAGYDDGTIEDMVIDRANRRVQLRSMGGRLLNGTLSQVSRTFAEGDYLLSRNYGPDPQRVWDIARTDGTKFLGGMMFDVEIPDVDFSSLTFKKPFSLHVGSGVLADIGQAKPLNTTYADIKSDEAYIDNFTSASYDVFRREVHLMYDDGTEAVIPLAEIERSGAPALSPKVRQQIDDLHRRGDLTLPTSTSGEGKPGDVTAISARAQDQFFDDPKTGVLRPAVLHPAVTPRLHEAVKDLDPDTANLLFQAADAFKAGGPPLPEGSEYAILIPLLARGGMRLTQSLVRSAENKALTREESSELGSIARRADDSAVAAGGKRPYASSLGELEEAAVISAYAPTAKQLPPKAKGVDWYEGGHETVTTVQEKYRNKPITVQETHVTGGTWTQLHTVLEADKATAENVTRAVTAKLDKFYDLVNNPTYAKSARDPKPIGPDTYRRVVLEGKPDEIVVHIHLREAKVTPELQAAADKALSGYSGLTELPPARVVVTGRR